MPETTNCPECSGQHTVLDDDSFVMVSTGAPLLLGHGHPARESNCLACGEFIGGLPLMLVGVAGLASPECTYGCVTAGAYLVHLHCLPAERDDVVQLLKKGMTCPARHPWE